MRLYGHVPFCACRCSHCDFALAVRAAVPSRAYVDAVLTEWRGEMGWGGKRDAQPPPCTRRA